MGTHHASEGVAVGDGQRREAKVLGLLTSSSAWEAPCRKEKLLAQASSA
jgi:hypothetical protein